MVVIVVAIIGTCIRRRRSHRGLAHCTPRAVEGSIGNVAAELRIAASAERPPLPMTTPSASFRFPQHLFTHTLNAFGARALQSHSSERFLTFRQMFLASRQFGAPALRRFALQTL